MRGSSISFLTRASIAWLDSCFGSFLFILARSHTSKGISRSIWNTLVVLELFLYRAALYSPYQSFAAFLSSPHLLRGTAASDSFARLLDGTYAQTNRSQQDRSSAQTSRETRWSREHSCSDDFILTR
jgi:hypothetical protein